MCHRRGRRRAVPVLLITLEGDHVAGADLLDWPTLALDPSEARRNDQDLSERMRVPAVRAPGSKVTALPAARAGACAANNGSIRTVPVNHSAGPCSKAVRRFV